MLDNPKSEHLLKRMNQSLFKRPELTKKKPCSYRLSADLSEKSNTLLIISKYRDVFRTHSNIYGGAFCEKS